METIQKSECREVGFFQKPHGVKGGISFIFDARYEPSLENKPVLLLEIDGLLVPYFMSEEGIRFRSSESAIVHLDWIENEEQSHAICGLSVFLKEEDLVHTEEEQSIHQLTGYDLYDQQIGKIGKIESVEDYGGNLLFQIQYKEQEILIPFHEELLIELDEKAKRIEIQCPEGIFDLE